MFLFKLQTCLVLARIWQKTSSGAYIIEIVKENISLSNLKHVEMELMVFVIFTSLKNM